MRKLHPASIKALSSPLTKRVTSVERLLAQENARDRQADTLEDLTADLGEASSGADVDGPELADPGWGASTNSPALTVYTTARMAVNPAALMEFRVDMNTPYRVYYPNENGARSYLQIAWYDAISGGSELSRDDLAFWQGVTFRRTLLVPAGAAAVAFVCGISSSNVYGLSINSVSNFSAHEFTRASRLSLDPRPSVQVEGIWERIASGGRELPIPSGRAPTVAQVTTGTGNLTNGAYLYRISWVDEYGETPASAAAPRVVVDATHKQTTVTAPQPIPAGATHWRVYRTLVDGGDSDPVYLVATVSRATASYQDNIADANLGAAAPEENTTLGRPVLPTAARQMANSMRSNTTLTWATSSGQEHGEYWYVAANGDWIAPDPVILEPGRYEMTILGARATTGGKADVYMDGQLIGQMDFYNGTTALNYKPTVAFVVEETGLHEFLFVVNGTSASGYRMFITEYWVRRLGR